MKSQLINNTSANDACRSSIRLCDLPIVEAIGLAAGYVPILWEEDEDPDERESGSAFRYVVTGIEHEAIIETDDYVEAFEALEAQPVPAALPKSREEALAMLRGIMGVGMVWHLDDDPRDVISDLSGRRMFTEEQAVWCEAFVSTLNVLFLDLADGAVVNAGAWRAADAVNWGGVAGESA